MDEPLELYDEATRRRIDGGGAVRRPRAGSRARFAGTVTFVTAIGLGLQEVFQPAEDEEVVLEVDTSGPGGDEPVTFDYDPTSVRRSRAHVRPWLAGRLP